MRPRRRSYVVVASLCALAGCLRPAPPALGAGDSAAAVDGGWVGGVEGGDADSADGTISDGTVSDGTVSDGTSSIADPVDGSTTASADATDAGATSWFADGACSPGAQRCVGAQLATCGSAGDGWSLSACFPGQYCAVDHCVPLQNNLIIVFDTSGSMNGWVPGVSCKQPGFPACPPTLGCSRMDVSKQVFLQALKKVNTQVTRLALFRFPQRITRRTGATCAAGYVSGQQTLSGDDASAQSVSTGSDWYWDHIAEIRCVPFPSSEAEAQLSDLQIGRWMDGVEILASSSKVCAGVGSGCGPHPSCGTGACCQQQCVSLPQPELRAHGGTPIGKTLFYIGEYLRHRVIVDGRACQSDAGCANPNYRCVAGACFDAARACRETQIVLFTDGGQLNDPTKFFSPRVAAQRLAYGLACATAADCVGGAVCSQGRCRPPSPTGYHCLADGAPCLPAETDQKSPLFCPVSGPKSSACLADAFNQTTAKALVSAHNVLRSPDGRAFGVRLPVVDISEAPDLQASHHLAMAGGGRLFTASSSDPLAFVSVLESAFDMKNKTVCGTTR